jgi:hypothetical protein
LAFVIAFKLEVYETCAVPAIGADLVVREFSTEWLWHFVGRDTVAFSLERIHATARAKLFEQRLYPTAAQAWVLALTH